MISNNQELFARINQLVADLAADGYPAEAEQLNNASQISSMPTEILGEIKITAESILACDKKGLRAGQLVEIISYVDQQFQSN